MPRGECQGRQRVSLLRSGRDQQITWSTALVSRNFFLSRAMASGVGSTRSSTPRLLASRISSGTMGSTPVPRSRSREYDDPRGSSPIEAVAYDHMWIATVATPSSFPSGQRLCRAGRRGCRSCRRSESIRTRNSGFASLRVFFSPHVHSLGGGLSGGAGRQTAGLGSS